MKRKSTIAAMVMAGAIALTGCNDADAVNRNISTDADNFRVARQVVFVNGITDEYLLSIEGFCQIERDETQVTVTCRTEENEGGDDGYVRHHLGLSDNVTYFVEQVDAHQVSSDYYKVTYKPTAIVPNLENTSGDD